jgi:polyketide synthase PksM
VHSAGVLRDGFLLHKTGADLDAVLAPKVAGVVNLDEASKALALDLFVCFSSNAGAFGNVGQADYAAANAFMDSYAAYRAGLAAQGQRHGRSLSVNWPLWAEGGMAMEPAAVQRMLQTTGMAPMETAAGIAALYRAADSGQAQVVVIAGRIGQVKKALAQAKRKSASATAAPLVADVGALREKVLATLAHVVSQLLKVPPEDIDGDSELIGYGFDSITMTEFGNIITNEWKIALSPTVFFEYQTLNDFATYLVTEHQAVLAEKFALPTQTPAAAAGQFTLPDAVAPTSRRARFAAAVAAPTQPRAGAEPIAIIGMSGEFPMAPDIDAFWDNLEQGRHCTQEVPADRWDWKELYGDPAKEANKTNVKWGGFIDGVGNFDPLFFNISPKEAEMMDPQQRLLMTHVWKALEDAGYSPASLSGSNTALFVGTGAVGYDALVAQASIATEGYSSTGSVPSIGPNRMSFFLNFTGPSEPVETACSSALVALRHGVIAIENGDSDLAVVGGINTIVTPAGHIAFGKAGMLSEDGRCKTFSAQANGYVRGEGVGMLVLKRLSAAEQAGDHIYGVIRGSAENHGGRATSLTAPNPKAQAALVVTAMQRAGIDPRTVGYIEAHGTGTALGDPIEVNGLKSAFRELYRQNGNAEVGEAHCGIGSVKTNIGHLELAAGAAGLIKVLLQLRHKKLVKSLHCETISPYIDLKGSPFYVVQETRDWQAARDAQGRELPRRAGVSSFGFGGVNAHVVIEEYVPSGAPAAAAAISASNPALIVLSARNPGRLRAQAEQLLSWLEREQPDPVELGRIAYTLQVGRDAMDERLAISASSTADLMRKLAACARGDESVQDCYRGQVKRNREALGVFAADDDMAQTIEAWIAKGKHVKLLQLWVKGLNFDWNKLYGAHKPGRVRLPTYPFEPERYWVALGEAGAVSWSVAAGGKRHPLVHANTSDLYEQRFSSTFQGNEFFLADHVVRGRRMLPGVAYLEMVRQAMQEASGQPEGGDAGMRLAQVTWLSPIVVGETPQQVHIAMFPEADGAVGFEIYSGTADAPVLHSRGQAAVLGLTRPEALDIAALRASCDRTVQGEECYALFSHAGLAYGPRMRPIQVLEVGKDVAVARLVCPEATGRQFVLHPSMMDGALQASLGLLVGGGKSALPFALEELEVFAPCQAQMWAVVRYSAGGSAGDAVVKLDIDLCDDAGLVCARFKRYSSRVQDTVPALAAPAPTPEKAENALSTLTLVPAWDRVTVGAVRDLPLENARVLVVGGSEGQRRALAAQYVQAHLLEISAGASSDAIAALLQPQGNFDHVVWIAPAEEASAPDDDRLMDAQQQGVLQCFRLVKALLAEGYGAKPLGWTIVTTQAQAVLRGDPIDAAHASVHGLAGSLAKEYPHWKVRLVDLEAGSWPQAALFAVAADPQGNAWAWRQGQWYQQRLLQGELAPMATAACRQGGVYVVIGGAGGIGEVWSEYMIRTYGAKILWIGRRPLDAAISDKIERLAALGPAPRYIAADATDRAALQAACDDIKQQLGRIDGVVHAAIVLQDKSLANMDEATFRASLAAKVDVSVRMAQVFGGEPLDFVLFFSSMQSFSKAPGQSNYAAGCTFKDAFAQQLRSAWPCAVKVMNWGYWGNVGIVASDAYRARMAQGGIGSIEPEEGMAALEQLLSGPLDQLALIKAGAQVADGIAAGTLCVHAARPDTALPDLPVTSDAHAQVLAQLESAGQHSPVAEIESLCTGLLYTQLDAIGLFSDTSFQVEEARARMRLDGKYAKWLDESLRVLERAGWVAFDGEFCTVTASEPPDAATAWARWESAKPAWLADANAKAQVALIETMLRALPQILQGQVPATDVMFPNSSMALVEGVYRQNQIADFFNAALADDLVAYVRARVERDGAVRLRILEIGAGTGGTSALLFDRLRPYQAQIADYCYTDLSRAFLFHAEQTFGADNPYLSYRRFDVSQPLAGQEIEAASFDVVVATNVLHATADVRESLRNAKAALRAGGLLLLNEISDKHLFSHLTFGLMDGWWLYEDDHLRIPGSPGLYPDTWKALLEDEGYVAVRFPARQAHRLGQQVVTAASDGVVRQRRMAAPAPASAPKPAGSPAAVDPGDAQLHEKATAAMKKLVGDAIRVPVHKLDPLETLDKYGIDSILAVQLATSVQAIFKGVTSTLFFEHPSVDALVRHFIATQRETVVQWVGIHGGGTASTPAPAPAKAVAPATRRRQRFAGASAPGAPVRQADNMAVAIVGLSGRYPQAQDTAAWWDQLRQARSGIGEIPKERWDNSVYFDPVKGKLGKTYSKWGGFIDGVDQFDPLFFSISPREAELLDPQERLFLQEAYASIEDAGYTPATLCGSRKVGVFVGVMNGNYPAGVRYWSIANRVSYLFNFQGPSLAVDTACSSSLTAIHLALESLRAGTSECAIAGGVNLIIDPKQYLGLSAMNMLSSDDKCRAFGAQADGFVDGEAVGAIVLKPLHQAVADGDHIYGVIKGSMVNAGGKTSGYTVPNPAAQAQLVGDALRRAQVHPRTVSYIEAHGTGTALGDPIEISGLSRAFGEATGDKQFCAIGSAKSNIGHCESAAGIAGVTKVLLQMRHGQIAPTLHVEELNPHIDFASTPFVVQRELAEWKRPVVEIDGQRREYPRIAGVSSFGAGGANAHVVIEEFVGGDDEAEPAVSEAQPGLFVLSARNAERLREKAAQLLAWVEREAPTAARLAAAAYTLQVGREAMEERMALIAGTEEALSARLAAFVAGDEHVDGLFQGQVKRNKETLGVFAADEDMAATVEAWIAKGKHEKLLELWTKGLALDWNKFYGGARPRRVSLPTYPFARERYWTPEGMPRLLAGHGAAPAPLHPAVHRNTSDLDGIRFSSTFDGSEAFIADYTLDGCAALAPTVQLEMARAALSAAAGSQSGAFETVTIGEVEWTQAPVAAGLPYQVQVALYPEAGGAVAFELLAGDDADTAGATLLCQGVMRGGAAAPEAPLDLAALRARCSIPRGVAEGYAAADGQGVGHGSRLRPLLALHAAPDGMLLAELAMGDATQYSLPPGLLEGIVVSVLGADTAATSGTPHRVAALDLFGPCRARMWAVIRPGRTADGSSWDVELADDDGVLCARLRGLTLSAGVAAEVAEMAVGADNADNPGALARGAVAPGCAVKLLAPDWTEQLPATEAPMAARRVVLLCGMDAIDSAALGEAVAAPCARVASDAAPLASMFHDAAAAVLAEVQRILADKPKGATLIQLVVPSAGERQALAGLGGMLKTARQENPKLLGQLLSVEDGEDAISLAAKLNDNARTAAVQVVRYANGVRQIAGWTELVDDPRASHPWRDGGVYLITGGAGGLGRIFAQEIAARVAQPVLILAGRSPAGEQTAELLEALRADGAHAEYHALDVHEAPAVERLVQAIVRTHGALHGIVHSAGVHRDSFMVKKSADECAAVLAPKVDGTVHLDQASAGQALDLFVCFSSGAGAMGNVGQADYAAGNAFMDAYARVRNDLVAQGLRHGRTLSVNWPLWAEGGMRLDESTVRHLKQTVGLTPLPTRDGIDALYGALATGRDQVMVVAGQLAQLSTLLAVGRVRQAQASVAGPVNADLSLLRTRLVARLRRLFSDTTKCDPDDISPDEPMEAYGIDSVMIMEMNRQLEAVFGELSKTLFFEYPTLEGMAEYLASERTQAALEWTGMSGAAAAARPAQPAQPQQPRQARRTGRRAARALAATASASAGREPIAVIGMSGRYPQARNLAQYWDNLRAGRDCISEIPAERWPIDGFFDPAPDALTRGKSYSKWGGFVDGFSEFDAGLFNVAPRDVVNIDPQERLFLQSCWEVLEDAGYTRRSLAEKHQGRVGVFAGITKTGFALYAPELWRKGQPLFPQTSFSSLANRVSYTLNLHGPSMPVDTMCSSSLTAIHEACEHLYRNECEAAIAGGVNLYLHPSNYMSLCGLRMLAQGPQTRAFGQGGNGFVPGEGVGTVLLKPLSKAVADGDHIYGVIRATAINHGGKTSGYTVPSPTAQAALVRDALEKAGIDARAVSYIEAHGTGTELGDPIELNGLSQAFRHDTQDLQFCALGSVKSNIGHLEAAAGIAGVTKVLLGMRHGQLPPTLHARQPNPNLDFGGSPFKLQHELGEWKRPRVLVDGKVREYPRIAGISSFGAGGANAHVVIEEYVAREDVTPAPHGPALVVLSARDTAALREQASQLLEWVDTHAPSPAQLASLAYTLQTGREPMTERLALLAGSAAELAMRLRDFLDGAGGDDIYRGQVARGKDTVSLFGADEELQEAVDKWLQRGKFGRVLELWVKGLAFDWNRLYGSVPPQRISLPTYPFARDRFWLPLDWSAPLPDSAAGAQAAPVQATPYVEPLSEPLPQALAEPADIPVAADTLPAADEATPADAIQLPQAGGSYPPALEANDEGGLRWSVRMGGDDHVLSHHELQGRRVLARGAYLDLAYRAFLQAGGPVPSSHYVRMEGLAWGGPLESTGGPVEAQVALYGTAAAGFAFEISSAVGDMAELHQCGEVTAAAHAGSEPAALETWLQQVTHTLGGDQYYGMLGEAGLHYGERMRCVESIHMGDDFLLARLVLADAARLAPGLDPCLIDGALQSAPGLLAKVGQSGPEQLRLAVQALHVYAPCQASMWAHATALGAEEGEGRIDIALYADDGALCVRMQAARLAPARADAADAPTPAQKALASPGDQPLRGQVAPEALDQDGLFAFASVAVDMSERGEDGYVAPASPAERLVADAWAKALHYDRLGCHDNFFDLGGHSLLAMEAMGQLREHFGDVVTLNMFFEAPTVSEFAAALEAASAVAAVARESAAAQAPSRMVWD